MTHLDMKPKKITPRQLDLLKFINSYQSWYQKSPSYTEMMKDLGVTSKQSIADLLTRLEEKGYIRIDTGQYRGVLITPKGRLDSKPKIVEGGEIRIFPIIDGTN